MTYVIPNFRTKKALREAVEKGEEVRAFEPGLGALPRGGGRVFIEGPHFPEPHRFYVQAEVDADGRVTKILK